MISSIRRGVFLLLSFTIIVATGYVLRPLDASSAFYQIDSFYQIQQNTLDVMVFGSSHAMRGIDTKLLNDYGISSYNYSYNWQNISTTKLFVEDAFKSQKPRVVLIEAYAVDKTMNNEESVLPEIYYTRYLRNTPSKREYLKKAFGDNIFLYLEYFFPVFKFHTQWENISQASFCKMRNSGHLLETYGFSPNEERVEISLPDASGFSQYQLDSKSLQEIQDIIRLCHDNNAYVIFFTEPWAGEYHYGESMKSLCNLEGCEYVDFFELASSICLDEKNDFADPGHVNSYGADKITKYIAENILVNYLSN